MHTLLKAGAAFAIAALMTGTLPPLSSRWRDVAKELHEAKPQAKLQALLSHAGKG